MCFCNSFIMSMDSPSTCVKWVSITCPSMSLITNKSSSLNFISSSLEEEEEEVWEEDFLGQRRQECSLSTSSLVFMVMVLLVGEFEAICPYPKHSKHFIELDPEPSKELWVFWEVIGKLVLVGKWVLGLLGRILIMFLFLSFPTTIVVVIVWATTLGLIFLFQLSFNFESQV